MCYNFNKLARANNQGYKIDEISPDHRCLIAMQGIIHD